jgi:hypothetical protein
LKKHKSPGSDQNPVELVQAACEKLVSMIHNLISSISPIHKTDDGVDLICVAQNKGNCRALVNAEKNHWVL